MNQDEFNNKVIFELNNIKCQIELNYYLEIKNNITSEIDRMKSQIIEIFNRKKDNVFKYQKNRSILMEAKSTINKLDREDMQLTDEEQEELNKAREEKEEVETWLNNENELKTIKKNELLNLLNTIENKQKQILQIESLINTFNKINPIINEPIDINILLDQINNMENIIDTPDFNEEDYNRLKDEFINQQKLVNEMIIIAKNYYSNSETTYNSNNQETDNKLNVFKLDYDIWNKTLEKLNNLKIEHEFKEKKVEIDPIINEEAIIPEVQEIEITPEDENIEINQEEAIVPEEQEIEITPEDENIEINQEEAIVPEVQEIEITPEDEKIEIVPEDTNVQTIYEFYGIKNPNETKEEPIKNGYKQEKEPYQTKLSKSIFSNLIMNTGLILKGDILLEGNVELVFNKYDEDNIDNSKDKILNILNNSEAKEKISTINNTITTILDSLNEGKISIEDANNNITELELENTNNINNIINNYDNIKDEVQSILEDNNKYNELSKLSLGKINNFDDLEHLTNEELNLISNINQNDYENLLIQLINKKQIEKAKNKINDYKTESIKTK